METASRDELLELLSHALSRSGNATLMTAELMQAQLKELGINMEIQLMESNDYVTKGLNTGELQSFLSGGGTEGLNETPTAIYTVIGPSNKMNPSKETAQFGLDLYAKIQGQFDVKERYKSMQEMAQWFWVDFVGRVDIGREAKIAAQRSEFGGFDWYSVYPQGTWNGAYRRA